MLSENVRSDLRCPCTERFELRHIADGAYQCLKTTCHHNKELFNSVDGKPVLISETYTDTVCREDTVVSYVERNGNKVKRLAAIFQPPSQVSINNAREYVACISSVVKNPRILVVGGGEVGPGVSIILDNENIEVVSTDIYSSPQVHVISDAHYLPFKDNSFDGVWIQAVLEHVVEPHLVVSEIYRVLKEGGVVYAETPFMQPVHEGAFDFTRFTHLGHIMLFRNFVPLSDGCVQGPLNAFIWNLKYLVWAVSRSKNVARLVSIAFHTILFPLKYSLRKNSEFDNASGYFFMGRKKTGYQTSHKDIIALYKGNIK